MLNDPAKANTFSVSESNSHGIRYASYCNIYQSALFPAYTFFLPTMLQAQVNSDHILFIHICLSLYLI